MKFKSLTAALFMVAAGLFLPSLATAQEANRSSLTKSLRR
jgi:hypothetical protein